MPASQGYTDNVVDLKVLRELVGSDWTNESVLVQSGVIEMDNTPLPSGTYSVAVRNQMFEDDEEGQALGIGSSLSSKERTQIEISHPIIRRGNVGLIDDIQGEVQAGGPDDIARIAQEARRAAAVYFDTAVLQALFGGAAANTGNQVGSGGIISLDLLNQLKWVRGDYGSRFQNGALLMRSTVAQTMWGLGLIAQTSNTFGVQGQNSIVLSGIAPKVLGMDVLVSDKITPPDATDEYIYALEKGAIKVRGDMTPKFRFSDVENGFADKIKFRITFSAGIKGIKWAGSQQDIYTNAELATSTNWALGARSAKHVPVARLLTDNA